MTDTRSLSLEALNDALSTEVRVELATQQLKPADLAETTGIAVYSLRRLLKGERSIPFAEMLIIADALGIEPVDLIDRAVERAIASQGRAPELMRIAEKYL